MGIFPTFALELCFAESTRSRVEAACQEAKLCLEPQTCEYEVVSTTIIFDHFLRKMRQCPFPITPSTPTRPPQSHESQDVFNATSRHRILYVIQSRDVSKILTSLFGHHEFHEQRSHDDNYDATYSENQLA